MYLMIRGYDIGKLLSIFFSLIIVRIESTIVPKLNNGVNLSHKVGLTMLFPLAALCKGQNTFQLLYVVKFPAALLPFVLLERIDC